MLPEGQAEVSSPRSRNARRSSAFPFFPLDLPPIPATLLPPQGLSLGVVLDSQASRRFRAFPR
jgi:hypothetical protein